MTNAIGSVWQKWDLHIHTPASFHWNGPRFHEMTLEQRDVACKKVIDRINELDVVAFCVMDYWTFDGFITLREYLSRNPNMRKKRIFPGIEFRMAAPTDFRLNSHVLINDEVTDDALKAFVVNLRLASDEEKPPTREHFIQIGRDFEPGKLKQIYGWAVEARADEEKMLRIGHETALVTRESVKKAIEVVGKDHCIIIQPYDTSDGMEKLDWLCHPYTDSYLMKWADCFETRSQIHVDLFLGNGHPKKAEIGKQFIENLGGYPKPVVAGSDAHQVEKYGVFPNNRATWLKAQPTFKGLKQVSHEPGLRCFIGEKPTKLSHIVENPTKYIRSIKLAKIHGSLLPETWFDGQEIILNPGLIAIIGNKGSGKSALADIIALAGNSHCTNMGFLNDRRFRQGANKAKQFTVTIGWADGTLTEVPLSKNPDQLQPERVRYLPQNFIEDLCNDIAAGNETEFGKELRKVIFLHVPEERQLKAGSLDELLDVLIKPHRKAIQQSQQTLRTLNERIVSNESEMSAATIKGYTTALELKQKELEAHDKIKPAEKPKPAENPEDANTKQTIGEIEKREASLLAIREKISSLQEERITLTAEQLGLTQLLAHIKNFVDYHEQFIAEYSASFEEAGFEVNEIIDVQIKQDPLTKRATEISTRIAQIKLDLEDKPVEGEFVVVKGMKAQEIDILAQLKKLQDQLNAPEKEYQSYLSELGKWKVRRNAIIGAADKLDTIEYLTDRIKRATEAVPLELDTLREERRGLVQRIHKELLAIRTSYEELYAPVQKVASEAAGAAGASDTLQLEFNAYISSAKFQENFLDFIHKNRTGTFYGEDESRKAVTDILNAHDLGTTEGVGAFTEAIYAALVEYDRNGVKEKIAIDAQLRQNKTIQELYDFLYGLPYLDVRYTLQLGGKDISQLSPGEKGALLLVFYLLLDNEEVPIIIDQPEHNLDNESVVRLLVDCIRKARARRQVVIVTHNPNLAVFCDADQMICCKIDKADGNKITYSTGAIEDYDVNQVSVTVLEGTYAAFDNRRKKYQKPQVDYGVSHD